MIIPFIFSMALYNEAPYLWFFYKALEMCKKHNWPIMAQEHYFNPVSYYNRKGRGEAGDAAFAERMGYALPKNSEVHLVQKCAIPREMTERIIKEKGSVTEAFYYYLTTPDPILENWITEQANIAEAVCGEKIEAFYVLQHNPSLSAAAEKRGIPVIHTELGPFREPSYLKTCFFDTDTLYGGDSLSKRYNDLRAEIAAGAKVPLLSRGDVLRLMLLDEKLTYADAEAASKPSKKLGLALGYTIEPHFNCQTAYTDAEMMFEARSLYNDDQLIARRHPGDPYGAQYPAYKTIMEQERRSTQDFILDCESVATIGSNVAMEAMYYGRPAYTFARCPSYLATSHDLTQAPGRADDDFLSFYALGYLTPFEVMLNAEYVRWRLSGPSEAEIYKMHFDYYLDRQNLTLSELNSRRAKKVQKA